MTRIQNNSMSFEEFLKETLPGLGLKRGYFKKKSIKRRMVKRLEYLGIDSFKEYKELLEKSSKEKREIYKIFTITISRLFRDADLFEYLKEEVFPLLLKRDKGEYKIWSVGCSCGEEVYSIKIVWEEFLKKRDKAKNNKLIIYATDVNEICLNKAKKAEYRKSSLEEIPPEMVNHYFINREGLYMINQFARDNIEFFVHNIILDDPIKEMDMIFCRNSVFTYFTLKYQEEALKKIYDNLADNGFLVIGHKEKLPGISQDMFKPFWSKGCLYKKINLICEK